MSDKPPTIFRLGCRIGAALRQLARCIEKGAYRVSMPRWLAQDEVVNK